MDIRDDLEWAVSSQGSSKEGGGGSESGKNNVSLKRTRFKDGGRGCEPRKVGASGSWGASQAVPAVKNLPASADVREAGLIPGSGRSPGGSRAQQPTPGFLPGECHGQRSPAGYSP